MKFGEYLRELRGNRSLREIDRLSGVSHTYLGSLERGIDPRTNSKILPSPDVIRSLSEVFGVSHISMMIRAGYVTQEEVLTYRREYGVDVLPKPPKIEVGGTITANAIIKELSETINAYSQRVIR